MSEEIAVSVNATGDDAPAMNDGATEDVVADTVEAPPEKQTEEPAEPLEEPPAVPEDIPIQPNEIKTKPDLPSESNNATTSNETTIKGDPENEVTSEPEIVEDIKEEFDAVDDTDYKKRGIKRRASDAFDDEVEFRGFEKPEELPQLEYSLTLQRLESELKAATKGFTPLRTVMATPLVPARANKRPRKDTGNEGSRPSSALSSRSEDDANPSASPAQRGRRNNSEMSSPLYRVPMDMGWKRELVYRAALDAHSRRNADIYYFMPSGKKLRSMREIGDHLSGTGLTLENFTFFKEPLGLDDPEKEIIRDAKLVGGFRRVESPIASPAPTVEGKRTPKPKAPKGASPEPSTTKSPPIKLKVKSVGARLSAPAAPPKKKPSPAPASPAPPATPDNNNSAAWKKPRPPEPGPAHLDVTHPVAPPPLTVPPLVIHIPKSSPPRLVTPPPRLVTPPPQPPPLQSKPTPQLTSPDLQSPRQLIQPCSMSCGSGVPSLSCTACLCLYHPACAGVKHMPPPNTFLCKNCRKSSSPPRSPPPLTHKSGVTASSAPAAVAVPTPRRLPVASQSNTHKPNDKRVLLRMKVSGGSDGERVWAVATPRGAAPRPPAPPAPPPAPSPRLIVRGTLPQSLAIINGRRFIVVPRPHPQPNQSNQPQHTAANDDKRKTRVPNGAPAPPMAAISPRRRGRPAKADAKDDVDHFTSFYEKAKSSNVIVQIFQYLGMRDLAHCARVCRAWRELVATPALWRHVRMKNSQVNDWGGLCAALKRNGTKWLDLRKMLLPQNDINFWDQFALHVAKVDTLERLEMCRCPARALEAASGALPLLRYLSALAIKDGTLNPAPLATPTLLTDLRLKSMQGLALSADLTPLRNLQNLRHLSLTSIKELGWRACDVVGELPNLESLELGECTFREEFGSVLARLTRLKRLRLERGTAHCAAPALLRSLAKLPNLTRLELVNIDVKVGFDDALAECKNIQRLLIIPTYVSQSATTNKQVLSGVLRLKETLTHLMWGVTIELLRVTELFIDQCSAGNGVQAKRELGECIPVLKPVPGCRLPMDHQLVAGPPQVEILPLPTLQRLLTAQLPNTKLKILRIPFHATWRQSLADFQ